MNPLKPRAQLLRKNATPQEKKLWYQYLKNYPLQWNRQKIIGTYIVDFYCSKVKLAIELDGSQHYDEKAEQYDRKRTDELNQYGITVIRFSNLDVAFHFSEVCEKIDGEVKKRQDEPHPSAP